MAPEQLQGAEADSRTDVFGFGCVLYKMITGRRAFGGDTPASVIAAVLDTNRSAPRQRGRARPSCTRGVHSDVRGQERGGPLVQWSRRVVGAPTPHTGG